MLDKAVTYVKITLETTREIRKKQQHQERQQTTFMFNKRKKFELTPRLKFGVGRGYSQNQILKVGAICCLVLAVLLTANAVRLLFFSKSAGISSINNQSPQVLGASDTRTPASAVEFTEYKVQKGDTLFSVSQHFSVDWTVLATLNNLKSPFTIKQGQTLKVPKQ